jgi:hypothetical protein
MKPSNESIAIAELVEAIEAVNNAHDKTLGDPSNFDLSGDLAFEIGKAIARAKHFKDLGEGGGQ